MQHAVESLHSFARSSQTMRDRGQKQREVQVEIKGEIYMER